MHSPRPQIGSIRQLYIPPFLSWYVAADGTLSAIAGTAEDEIPGRVQYLTGQDFHDAFADHPTAIECIERALAGQPDAGGDDAWDLSWYHVVTPAGDGRGVDGWSVIVPTTSMAAEPDGAHTWLATDEVREPGIYIGRGDLIRYNGRRAVRVELCDAAAMLRIIRTHPQRFEYLVPPESCERSPHPASPTAPALPGYPPRIVR